MGQKFALLCVQKSLNSLARSDYVDEDGVLGPQTLEACKHQDPSALAHAMCAVRLLEYGSRGKYSDSRRVFLDGWINRIRSLLSVI